MVHQQCRGRPVRQTGCHKPWDLSRSRAASARLPWATCGPAVPSRPWPALLEPCNAVMEEVLPLRRVLSNAMSRLGIRPCAGAGPPPGSLVATTAQFARRVGCLRSRVATSVWQVTRSPCGKGQDINVVVGYGNFFHNWTLPCECT